jgi:hypothetical protein
MKPMKVVFILGSGHCGATLLDLILDSHSQMCGIGEFHSGRATSICSCGKPASECAIWRNALGPLPWKEQGIFKSKADLLFDRGQYRMTRGEHVPVDPQAFIASNLEVFKKVLAGRGKSIIVDSSKEVERTELLSISPEIEPIMIHVVRDGHGSTWTYINKYKKVFPYFYMWAFSNLKVEVLRRRFKRIAGGRGKFIYLRLPDLVRDPSGVVSRLCDEIGVPFEPSMLLFDEHPHHQIEGNRTRFAKGHTIYPDSWRKEMPAGLRVFWTLCFGWLNVYYMRLKRSFS